MRIFSFWRIFFGAGFFRGKTLSWSTNDDNDLPMIAILREAITHGHNLLPPESN